MLDITVLFPNIISMASDIGKNLNVHIPLKFTRIECTVILEVTHINVTKNNDLIIK